MIASPPCEIWSATSAATAARRSTKAYPALFGGRRHDPFWAFEEVVAEAHLAKTCCLSQITLLTGWISPSEKRYSESGLLSARIPGGRTGSILKRAGFPHGISSERNVFRFTRVRSGYRRKKIGLHPLGPRAPEARGCTRRCGRPCCQRRPRRSPCPSQSMI